MLGLACDVQMREGAVCDDWIDILIFQFQLAKPQDKGGVYDKSAVNDAVGP